MRAFGVRTGAVGSAPWRAGVNPFELSELEVAAGMLLDRKMDRIPHGRGPVPTPLGALESLAARLLTRDPCVVAFSGGRDSSALLAVLCEVARREGLTPPVAVTARWVGDVASDEAEWQEEVVRAIGLRDWEVIHPDDDLDLLGPLARDALGVHGLLWPPPAYAVVPMIRRAAGGSFVSGHGGDEVLGLWDYAATWSDLRRRRRPPVRAVAALGVGFLPRALRRVVARRSSQPYQTWLTPDARARLADDMARERTTEPVWWLDHPVTAAHRRSLRLGADSFRRLCADVGAEFAAPFVDETFLQALARWGGRTGRGDRTSVMTELFSGLLPPAVLSRSTKASFGAVFWGPAARAFAREWDGRGLDEALVVPEELRAAWLAPLPVYGAALPLHAAWLHHRPPAF